MNWFENVRSFIVIMDIVQKLWVGYFLPYSSKENI